jgi:salicylate hydroxylase
MTVPRSTAIAIVGAGIGGLTAALALLRAGFGVRVYEQAPRLGEVGAGISITPNAVKGLRSIGLDAFLATAGDVPPMQVVRHYRTGEILIAIDRADTPARYGAPYYQTHRADLHAALVSALREADPSAVVLGAQLRELAEDEDGVTLRLANGTAARAEVAIGCDGAKSAVRASHFAADAPDFSGYVAWRGMVPAAGLGADPFPPGSSIWTGPGHQFVRYPVRKGAFVNYVAFARTGVWQAESWSMRAPITEVLAEFAGWDDEVARTVRATPDGMCNRWGLFARAPLSHWATDRVALLGDAAHPMLPWFGQGAACAIEDGVILARAFAASGSIAEALARYQAARLERVNLIYRESLAGGERLAGADPDALRHAPVRNEDSLGIFSYDPTTVPV